MITAAKARGVAANFAGVPIGAACGVMSHSAGQAAAASVLLVLGIWLAR